jgi:56kDa selenium binding protein (SBP56)
MSEANQHSSTASFYASPAEALQAPREELLYLACLHGGTGVDAPDFLAVVDAEDGRIVHETHPPARVAADRCSRAHAVVHS